VKLTKAYRHFLLGVDKDEVLKLFELRGERNNKIGTVMPFSFSTYEKFDIDASICHSDYRLLYKANTPIFRWEKVIT
jgi:hypothetical protein